MSFVTRLSNVHFMQPDIKHGIKVIDCAVRSDVRLFPSRYCSSSCSTSASNFTDQIHLITRIDFNASGFRGIFVNRSYCKSS